MQRLKQVLRTQNRFELEKQIGCPRAPFALGRRESYSLWVDEDRECRAQAAGESWGDIACRIEAEVCGVVDQYKGTRPDPQVVRQGKWSERRDEARNAEEGGREGREWLTR